MPIVTGDELNMRACFPQKLGQLHGKTYVTRFVLRIPRFPLKCSLPGKPLPAASLTELALPHSRFLTLHFCKGLSLSHMKYIFLNTQWSFLNTQ